MARKDTSDGTTMGELVDLRLSILSLRRERECQGLTLTDVAERAGIDDGKTEPGRPEDRSPG